jgi:hypothetical protein
MGLYHFYNQLLLKTLLVELYLKDCQKGAKKGVKRCFKVLEVAGCQKGVK